MEVQIVQILVQVGALGLLFMLIWKVPAWLKLNNDARMAELKLAASEREKLLLAYKEEQKLDRQASAERDAALIGAIQDLRDVNGEKLDTINQTLVKTCRHP